jgi:hypothetical protein
MKQIYVALEHAGKTHPVGVMRFDVKQGFGYFTYLPTYDGPPLDPVNLDYRKPVDPKDRLRRAERVFVVDSAANPGLMHSVFVDAMPGQWGMTVLAAEYPEIRQMKDCEKLYWMNARTSGALSFFVQRRADEVPVKGLDQLEAVRKQCAEFLAKLQKMGLEGVRNPAVASHGGVMPKASYEDAQGRHWIAKFDRPGEGTQYSVLEHAACVMAQRCGITTPETKTLADGMGGHMFLTERYDRGPNDRNHKVSLMSLTGAKEAGAGDYRDIFAVLKQVTNPATWPAQRDEMLRRMAFNIGLNVTDDHLRNHEVRLLNSGNWELSPAYDLVPVSGPSPHQCAVFGNARASINLQNPATKELWTRIASELGATPEHVLGIVGSVASTIEAEWPSLVESVGLNRFNQMSALMAAEVGCGVPFPERAKSQAVVPLDARAKAELASGQQLMARTLAALRGTQPVARGEDLTLSKALLALSEAAPRLAHLVRGAGHHAASELLLMAPLKNAARAVLESSNADPNVWRDLEDASSSIEAVVSPRATAAARPRTP